MKMSIKPFITFIIVVCTMSVFVDAFGVDNSPHLPQYRVGTYNIRQSAASADKHTPNSWSARRDAIADLISKMNLDVFGLQEVRPDQLAFLKKKLPEYEFVGDFRNADKKTGEASPVVYRKSRFIDESKGTFWLSETPDVPGVKGWGSACPRVCSYIILKDRLSSARFCFANAHTDHVSAMAREKGMLLVIERMKSLGDSLPIVFTGDHNCRETDTPARAVSAILKDAVRHTLHSPPSGPWRTYNAWKWKEKELSALDAMKLPADELSDGLDGARIDYIYVSHDIKVLDYVVRNDTRPGTIYYPSDHFPVVSTIMLTVK
jgi:endonuclease/exonuclease/phosphatase family metal-dependent hydrolase